MLDFIHERFGSVIEEEVGFVEEEDEFRLIGISDFGEFFEKFGEEPEEECGVKLGALHELVGSEDVDEAFAGVGGAHEVFEIEGGLTEEFFAALLFKDKEGALDRTDGGGADLSVFGLDFFGVVADEVEHAFEIFKIKHEEVLVVGDGEGDIEDAFLGFVELQELGEEKGAHLGDGGSDLVALIGEQIPEDDGSGFVCVVLEIDDLGALFEFWISASGLGESAEVAFDIGHEDGDTHLGELLGEDLEGDGFSGSGCAGDESVAVGEFGELVDGFG